MNAVSSITLGGPREEKQKARELIAQGYDPISRLNENKEMIDAMIRTEIGALDRKVKHGEHLSFQEAFCGMCYVLAATNHRFRVDCAGIFARACGGQLTHERAIALASAFLNLMAAKESFSVLTHEEIAGMVTAALMDTVVSLRLGRVIETCGMGGDKGYSREGKSMKGINASTLSSLVLAGVGLPCVKHGSYGNTSVIGSTEAIEAFGARTSMTSLAEFEKIWRACGYCYLDAHWCKTIHDLSHLLRMETINHVIGPMTPPVSCDTEISRIMGVNEKVHPQTVAKAYALLHSLGKVNAGGVVVVAGLDEYGGTVDPLDFASVRRHTILDELSPYASVVSLSFRDRYLGTFLISPEDFGMGICAERVQVRNEREEIWKANVEALRGTDSDLTVYLAMNAALGLYASKCLELQDLVTIGGRLNRQYLKSCFETCLKAITSGRAFDVLEKYVAESGGTLALPA